MGDPAPQVLGTYQHYHILSAQLPFATAAAQGVMDSMRQGPLPWVRISFAPSPTCTRKHATSQMPLIQHFRLSSLLHCSIDTQGFQATQYQHIAQLINVTHPASCCHVLQGYPWPGPPPPGTPGGCSQQHACAGIANWQYPLPMWYWGYPLQLMARPLYICPAYGHITISLPA